MYSKDRGFTHRMSQPTAGDRSPSYRQNPPERVRVPPNYSGHAIVDGEERSLGSVLSPDSDTPPAAELPITEQPTPRFDGLPCVSDLGDSHRHAPRTLPASFAVTEDASPPPPAEEERSAGIGMSADAEEPPRATSAPPSAETSARGQSLLPSTRSLLGNGLGLEELLILGLILFLLREGEGEDRGDLDETVILLGLLLLLG